MWVSEASVARESSACGSRWASGTAATGSSPQTYAHDHRWARYFKKVAERALNAKKKFKALALYKAFKAIAAQKKKFKR